MEARRDPGRAPAALATAGRAAAATCGVLSVVLAAFVVWRSAALLALLYVAAILAIVLDRPVDALVRRGLGRPWALALVLSGVGAAATAIAVGLGSLASQVTALAAAAPALADRLRAALVGTFGSTVGATSLTRWFDDTLARGASALAGSVVGVAGEVANTAGGLLTELVLAVLLLASGPDLVRRALGALPPARRPRAERLARELAIALGGYLAGLAAIVAARILATAAFLALARIPYVVPLALLAGASVVIPYAGAVLRFLGIGAAAWATRGSAGAVAALAFLALYDLVENYLLSPIVYRRTVGVSAIGQILAVLFLGYHLGVVGAVLAIPLAATAQIVVRTLRSATTSQRAGATPADSTGPRTPAEPAAGPTEGEAPEGPRPQREAPWNGPSGR